MEQNDGRDIIRMTDINKVYRMGSGTYAALDGINLRISTGEYVAIVGPSGAGKSTLMNLIGCLDKPTSGEYILDGVDTDCGDNKLAEIRNRKIGFIFQNYNLLPKSNVMENVELPLLYLGYTDREAREKVKAAVEKVGLTSHMRHKPTELSGGQMQRVAIARALVTGPQIILADEPTGALDTKTGEEVLKLLTDLNAEGNTVIIITHNMEIASRTKRMIRMRDGRITSDTRNESVVVS